MLLLESIDAKRRSALCRPPTNSGCVCGAVRVGCDGAFRGLERGFAKVRVRVALLRAT